MLNVVGGFRVPTISASGDSRVRWSNSAVTRILVVMLLENEDEYVVAKTVFVRRCVPRSVDDRDVR